MRVVWRLLFFHWPSLLILLIPSVAIAFVIRTLALDIVWLVVPGYTIWFIAYARRLRKRDEALYGFLSADEREVLGLTTESILTTKKLDPARYLLVLSWMTFFALGFFQNLS